ncbi:glycosylhydrolase-like jelly roll fold domain-containing protein [Paenibacillus luteus]|uniref:glycosylhydrolase-like jelly roll fold domain-containing protein n=1 Tax=Paenibacillus luteus TaxID=2545753 RepID=UPI0011447DA9|nr:glycosylhydrolase-like jelly roll fold domain-containing protein [Paenibacillus luteus]
MSSRLKDVLAGKGDNYLLPFLWQRGESEAVIREELARIDEVGIKAVCIESRPHPDFLGPGWWRDMDIIMDEARSRGMRVWVFDDDHFPTGHAAGRMKDAAPELRRRFLAERRIDAVGPMKGSSFLVKPWLQEGDELVAVLAARREQGSGVIQGEILDLENFLHGETLYWDVPTGFWSIYLMVETSEGADSSKREYINPIVGESTQVLIDAVYEIYYERYREDFGYTFAGFFSDEPGFYNDFNSYDFTSVPGKPRVVLPWCKDMLSKLNVEKGSSFKALLPLLWEDGGEQAAQARYVYMNVISKLYAEHFCGRLGEWCRERNVEYIGHIIEDNNAHARLGCGPGHFFRSMWGQDMSGIDVVLHQIMPGFDETPFSWIAGNTDSEFFHYGLAKLGSSLAHIDPKKKGRAMCEIFGAYGWSEGLKLMKWLTDHMLVRGINHFVPHAFSQKDFPDQDCPPHFYARGHNPQYRYYGELNRYTNRLCHLLSGGMHRATAAVLYHAEAEWSGASMLFQKPVKALLQAQIDCDVLPADSIISDALVSEGKLAIHAEEYDCFIVPYAEALPVRLLERLFAMAEDGLPIIWVDALPKRSSEGKEISAELERLQVLSNVHVIPLTSLASSLKKLGLYEIEVEGEQPWLRNYHYEQPNFHVYLFFNEHPYEEINTKVHLPKHAQAAVYNGFDNTATVLDVAAFHNGLLLPLKLSPYESIVVIAGKQLPDGIEWTAAAVPAEEVLLLEGSWQVFTARSEQYPNFESWGRLDKLQSMGHPELLPSFSGTFRYELDFRWSHEIEPAWLDLGDAYETAEVWINDERVGIKLCAPYRFNICGTVHQGANKLVVEVTNTLAKQQHDFFSRFMQQEPSGLLGPVRFLAGEPNRVKALEGTADEQG